MIFSACMKIVHTNTNEVQDASGFIVVSKYWKTNGHHIKIQHLFFVYCNGLHIASQAELSTGLSLQPVTHPQQLLEVSDGLNNTAQCLRREYSLNIRELQDNARLSDTNLVALQTSKMHQADDPSCSRPAIDKNDR